MGMPYYSPMPQGKYVLDLPKKPEILRTKISTGLGDTDHVPDPLLWNYCVLTSRLPFLWEDGVTKKKDLPLKFPNLGLAKRDMDLLVDKFRVADLMCNINPSVFLDYVEANRVIHLNLCKFFKTEKAFRMVVKARVLVVERARGLRLSPEEEAIITMVSHNI